MNWFRKWMMLDGALHEEVGLEAWKSCLLLGVPSSLLFLQKLAEFVLCTTWHNLGVPWSLFLRILAEFVLCTLGILLHHGPNDNNLWSMEA